ncbi:unnamed protein product [Spirodela intermedia]|uniref:J domain-containing protein n=1 Tax=Spirodela intermedia TaxID=51605 RepID=A0A7I8IXF5_SPIIN|nr:unnamed protein product [Spirodela intermedia]CAA6661680.1 unnamed protein product [Spirodela intermedia]
MASAVATAVTRGGGGSSEPSKEHYRTLRVQPGASEKEVKKAFRELALQVIHLGSSDCFLRSAVSSGCVQGSNCGTQFHQINEAYDIVMNSLREAEEPQRKQEWSDEGDDQMRGMYDPSWDLWEEWMGWEGAGIRDYSSHINPYI